MRASILSLALFLLVSPASAATPSVDLVNAFPAQDTFKRPLYLAYTELDEAHCYVVEQYGRIYRIPRDGNESGRQLFLDWRDRAYSPANGGFNEEGLLGFAFDPELDLDDRPYCYIYYSEKTGRRSRRSVISRLEIERKDERLVADPKSEHVIWTLDQPAMNHNGGTILFGPDGMLYIGMGDGGAAGDRFKHGQNLKSQHGAILRIDVSASTKAEPYRVPDDNPFVGKDAAPEIWAYGLRNVWRMSFDSETGELWCGDVGQNKWEEVNRIVKGGNYGWPLREGLHAYQRGVKESELEGLIEPVAEYHHRDGISVTGGHIYRGKAIPELVGAYVYGDFATGRLWAVHEDREGGDHEVHDLMRTRKQIASFAEEPSGEHLLLCFDGRIYRLVPAVEDF